MKTLIAVMSCNRPGFLRETLKCLKVQAGNTVADREIRFPHDGAVTFQSKITCAAQSDIDNFVAGFRSHFPDGKVHLRDENIAICANLCRAENHTLSMRQFLFANLFEEGLASYQVYLWSMEIFWRSAERSPRGALFRPTETTPRRPMRLPGGGAKPSAWTITGASVCGATTGPFLRIWPPTATRRAAARRKMRGKSGHAAGSGFGAAGRSLGSAAISVRTART